MNDFLAVIASDFAILIYLTIAIFLTFFFAVKYTKVLKKKQQENDVIIIKNRDADLDKSLLNEKRGNI